MVETYVVSHKTNDFINEKHLNVILAGANNTVQTDVLCDNVGDNISSKNSQYNEMTAIYWLWKHYEEIGNPEYIGIQQYRRYFHTIDKKYSYYESEQIDNVIDTIKIDQEKFNQILGEYDFIVPCPMKVKSVKQQFIKSHGNESIDAVTDIIASLTPEYMPILREYFDGTRNYLYNMFVFDKKTFFEYCEWIFKILDEYSNKSNNKGRYFISERLTGIFITKLISEGKKAYHMPVVFISGSRKTIKQAIKESKNNKKNNASTRQIIRPYVVRIMPKSLWIKWKRKQFELI